VPVALKYPHHVSLKKLRIAYYLDDGLVTPALDVQHTVQQAVDALAQHGIAVTLSRPEVLKEAFDILWGSFFQDGDGAQTYLNEVHALGTENLSALHEAFIEEAKMNQKDVTTLLKNLKRIGEFRMHMQSFIESYDVIICPPYATTAPHHGESLQSLQNANYSMPYNLTGWPAVVVRCGTSREGLPIGVQVIARPWHDHVALAVASFLEKALGGYQPPTQPR
jgi:amidase